MFGSRQLVGDETFMPGPTAATKSLIVPPVKPGTNVKFNTVKGNTVNSDVWIVCE